MTLSELRQVAALLSRISVLDGYTFNISRCVTVEDGWIMGMKSHDCHIFM